MSTPARAAEESAASPLSTLAWIRRVMSGRPRITRDDVWAKIHVGHPRLADCDVDRVSTTFRTVGEECASAVADGHLTRRDVLAIAVARVHGDLTPYGRQSLSSVHAARLSALGMFMLVERPAMVASGFAPRLETTVDQALGYADREFRSWLREATRPSYEMRRAKKGQEQWLAGGVDWAYRYPDRAEWKEAWEKKKRRVLRMLRARGLSDVERVHNNPTGKREEGDADVVDSILIQLDVERMSEYWYWPMGGIPGVPDRKLRDLIEPHLPMAGEPQLPAPEAPHGDPQDISNNGEAERRRLIQIRRDAQAVRGLKPMVDFVETDYDEGAPRPDHVTRDPEYGALHAAEFTRAIHEVLDALEARRRSDDRASPAVRAYLEQVLATGVPPSQQEIAKAHGISEGTLSDRLTKARAAMAKHPAMKDFRD